MQGLRERAKASARGVSPLALLSFKSSLEGQKHGGCRGFSSSIKRVPPLHTHRVRPGFAAHRRCTAAWLLPLEWPGPSVNTTVVVLRGPGPLLCPHSNQTAVPLHGVSGSRLKPFLDGTLLTVSCMQLLGRHRNSETLADHEARTEPGDRTCRKLVERVVELQRCSVEPLARADNGLFNYGELSAQFHE